MTRSRLRLSSILLAVILLAPVLTYGQEATISGVITDATGGVLPGVTVTALHTASGNTFLAVTDERGNFRIPARTGEFRVTAELQGFATIMRALELLVGVNVVVNLQMVPSTIQETVTVTGDAPLINTRSSTLSGNIDPRQLQELPVNGRSWQDLVLLAPGSRANATADTPVDRTTGGTYQLNIDGQQITQLITMSGQFGNPKFSRDAIAEFQFVANRFDATQGRSLGVQVNAITKSGTNSYTGTLGSYFRDDKLNAADHVVRRVLPYSDQQISATLGGPIRKDRIHFFGNFEYEREPQTFAYTTPYPRFNYQLVGTRREKSGGGRIDAQFSPKTRLTVRVTNWRNFFPYGGAGVVLASSTQTPGSATETHRWTNEVVGTLTRVMGVRAVNELKVGYAQYRWNLHGLATTNWPPSLELPASAPKLGSPRIALRGGLVIGMGNQFAPQEFFQDTYSFRNDFTYSYDARGRHNMKFGGEYLYFPLWQYFCNYCLGELQADTAAPPSNLQDLFPDLLDARTWNLAPLSSIAIRWRQGFGDFTFKTPRHVYAGWIQDDWTLSQRLTVNLGARYDLQANVFTNSTEILPFLPGNRSNDSNNLAPRIGFALNVDQRTIIRGGFGQFYGEVPNTNSHYPKMYSQTILADVLNDGRSDFASKPFNGPTPTYAQILARMCTPAAPFAAGCIRRTLLNTIPSASSVIPYTYQSSVGIQRQIGATMAVTADYVYSAGRKLPGSRNANLAYNAPAHSNYGSRDLAHLPYPDWGVALVTFNEGLSNTHALDTSFTKRFDHRWQLSATYSLAALWDQDVPLFRNVELPSDLGAEYTLASTDQRHRAVINGIWDVAGGFQLSGLYFFGSGQRFSTNWGSDLRDVGAGGSNRLRPDGSIVPRNTLVGQPVHRVDMRLQQRVRAARHTTIDGVLEIFNVFDHANYGSYVTQQSNVQYGRPTLNLNVAYVPRTMQLGFRIAF